MGILSVISTEGVISTLKKYKRSMFVRKLQIVILLSFVGAISLVAQTDPLATAETKALYSFLKNSAKNGTAFGVQTTTSTGIGWKTDQASPLLSDVKTITGDYPAVFGFDFKKWKFNTDKGWMTDLEQVKEIYRRGGIVTISWHTDNPFTGGNCKDKDQVKIEELLPGGIKNTHFNSWLDSIAAFAHAAKVDGVHVPILFRPLHENTGRWFWWGSDNHPDSYISLFRYIVDYLQTEKQVRNNFV